MPGEVEIIARAGLQVGPDGTARIAAEHRVLTALAE
jgi:hypothetical protein